MYKSPVFLLIVVFFLWIQPFRVYAQISCKDVSAIQNEFLKNHILYDKLSFNLKERTLNQFIKNLDREKIYFLATDIRNIKRKNNRLFSDLSNKRCQGLYYIYDIYLRRVNERIAFAQKLLNDKFLFIKSLKHILDEDLNYHPKSTKEANEKMKAYVHYKVAHSFLVEKDLKKSVNYISLILKNIQKQIYSWKPILSFKEKRRCWNKSKDSFKACKPYKWFSNYLNAYSQSLDPHSSYLDKEALEQFYISMHLRLEGIGATLTSQFGYTIVKEVIPGGAAFKSKKIEPEDIILEVGQSPNKLVSIFGERLDDVISIIRGPKGSPVYLKISRKKENSKNHVFVVKLIRSVVNLKDKEASISYHEKEVDGKTYKIGLLKVDSFYGSYNSGKSVTRDTTKLLKEAKKENIQALVLDLSNNRGGSLDEAVYLSGLFFSRGNVVKQSARDVKHTYILKDYDSRVFYNGPLVVLVNRYSASASEIVAGALQDYNRAVVVGGDHTFGKGSIQSIDRLTSLSAIKTTVGLYFIPSGRSTQKTGVSSDIVFPSVLHIDELGEKNLDHVLPSQVIESFKSGSKDIFLEKSTDWMPINKTMVEQLKQISEKRVAKNEKFQDILKDIEKQKKDILDKKTITIAEVLKNGSDKEEGDSDEGGLFTDDQKKYFERPDVQEALNVAGDFVLFSSKPVTKTTVKN